MKKRGLIFIVCLLIVALCALTLAACNDDPPENVKVTFSGEGVQSFEKTVVKGKTVEKPQDPQRTGYDFEEWLLDGATFDFASTVNGNISLVAKWSAKKFTVTLDVNGGDALTQTTKQVTFGAQYDLGTATKADKIFGGWSYGGSAITNKDGASLSAWSLTENITAVAIWQDKPNDDIIKNGWQYKQLANGEWEISAISKYSYPTEVVIPSSYDGKPVTKIGSMRYLNAAEVKIPSSVTEIGASAFASNENVEIVDMSEFAGKIGASAFANNEVKIIDLGGATEICEKAFENTKVVIFAIPSTVTRIGDKAFKSLDTFEIGFAGAAFPTLGNDVFGNGVRGDEALQIVARACAWDAVLAGAETGTMQIVRRFLQVEEVDPYSFSDEEMDQSEVTQGIFKNDSRDLTLYRGYSMTAVIYDFAQVATTEMYADTHVYIEDEDGVRDTYLIDYTASTLTMLAKNQKGETVSDNTLYDYQGSDLVYRVPDGVTAVASGACINNGTTRFLILGDGVASVGDYAFAMGQLFGIEFGTGIRSIGGGAFLNQSYLQQVVFRGTTPPTIGEAAFCVLSQIGVCPTFMYNSLSQFGVYAYIYTPLSTASYDDVNASAFVEAFNASIATIDNLPMDGNNDPITYKMGYEGEFKKLETDGTFAAGGSASTPYGAIKFTGTDTGYALIEFGEDSGYTGLGYVYYSSMNLPGYTESNAPKKLSIYTRFVDSSDGGYIDKFDVQGMFSGGKLILRGAEAGSYGAFDADKLTLDGFGKYTFVSELGSVSTGTYSVTGNTIELVGMESATATFDADNSTVTYKGNVMTALGGEAGVYYDLDNAAKITLDGKQYTVGSGNDEKTYSGKLTLEYKDEKITVGYSVQFSEIIFNLNGMERKWDYSTTSEDYVVRGYFGPGSYDNMLQFKIVTKSGEGTYTFEDDERIQITLDGYFTAEMIDGEITDKFRYYVFKQSGAILLIASKDDGDAEIEVLYLLPDNKFKLAGVSAPEACGWFVSAGANRFVAFDGLGNLLYFDGSEYKSGTYTFDISTGALNTTVEGNETQTNGMLDLEKYRGYMVYDRWGDTYMALSQGRPFETFKTSYGTSMSISSTTFICAEDGDKIVSTSPSFNIYYAYGTLFISTYNNVFAMVEIDSLADGATATFEYTVKKGETPITATYRIVFTETDGIFKAEITPFEQYAEVVTATIDGETYYFAWFNDAKSSVAIYTLDSYGGTLTVGGAVIWQEDATFTVGEYTVTGYGTANVTLTKNDQ